MVLTSVIVCEGEDVNKEGLTMDINIKDAKRKPMGCCGHP